MSPLITTLSDEMCLSFYYMMNGEKIHPTRGLSVFLKDASNQYINLPFIKGGHQGNRWKRAALKLPKMEINFQVNYISVGFFQGLVSKAFF